MIPIIMALTGVAGLLLLVELLWREKIMHKTSGRTLIHILVACWVAVWPLFLDLKVIGYLALAMFGVIAISRSLNILQSIHKVKRQTIGELLFPLAIFLCTSLTDNTIVFAVAMLQLGLADGLASSVGSRTLYKPYKVLGQVKSVSGTLTFLIISFVITALALSSLNISGSGLIAILFLLPILTATAENISVFGLDDISVPLISLLLLNALI